MKRFGRDHRGRLVGSGIDPRYPKISSDFLAVLAEANLLHLLQELKEEKMVL